MPQPARTPSPPTLSGSRVPVADGEAWDPLRGGFFVAQAGVDGALLLTENLTSLWSQGMRVGSRALEEWTASVDTAVAEVEHAHDLAQLGQVTTALLQRQMAGSIRLFEAAQTGWHDAELRWLRRTRKHSLELVRRALPALGPVPMFGLWEPSPLTPWGNAQAEWLATMGRWIEAVLPEPTRPA